MSWPVVPGAPGLPWTEILVCPRCRKDLKEQSRAGELIGLRCAHCQRSYPVVDGIPWMDEALSRPNLDP